ncbi:MAG: peptidylprolyl isomerase [Ignavibacteriaceae bacterium]
MILFRQNARYFAVLIITLLVNSSVLFSQQINDKPVARVGTKIITEREFLERYEFSPGLQRNNKSGTESSKLKFLYTIIAEKLWAQESSALGLDKLEVMKFSRDEFEKMFVRDALYKKEIAEKINISNDELLQAFYRNRNRLKVNFIFSEDESEIKNIYSMIIQGIVFDSVLIVRPEFDEQKEPWDVVYGQMDPAVEDSLYNLKVGECTAPILTPDGWYIFRLTNKIESMLNTAEDLQNSNLEAEKIIKARKSQKLHLKFFEEFFNDKKIDVNPALFEILVEKISTRFKWKRDNYRISDNNLYNLLAEDVNTIENEFGRDSLKLILIEFENDPHTLKQFIRILAFDGFASEDYEIQFVRKLLDTKTRQIIERELLAKEGFERGYNLLPEVQADVNMWTDNYLFQMLQNKFLDSVKVSDDEVYSYYKQLNEEEKYPQLINIIEILTDSMEIVDIIFQEIRDGKEFNELAKQYTKREWTKKNSGEFGFFPSSQFGEIGRIAVTMKIGEIYGPLKVPEGYSIFKLIDKRDSVTAASQSYEKVKDEYKRELLYLKSKLRMDSYTVDLAIKYGVGIDFGLLESIQVTNISSFALRKLGFGGKITAVPIVAPNVDWVQPWQKKIEVIQ